MTKKQEVTTLFLTEEEWLLTNCAMIEYLVDEVTTLANKHKTLLAAITARDEIDTVVGCINEESKSIMALLNIRMDCIKHLDDFYGSENYHKVKQGMH